MRNDVIFGKVVKKLQEKGILNARRRVRFQYTADNEVLEGYVAQQVGVKRRNVFSDYEEYANATVEAPMSRYLSASPKNKVKFTSGLFSAYFPVGRSGTVEVTLDTLALFPDNKVTEKNKKKIEQTMKELREERSHSRE